MKSLNSNKHTKIKSRKNIIVKLWLKAQLFINYQHLEVNLNKYCAENTKKSEIWGCLECLLKLFFLYFIFVILLFKFCFMVICWKLNSLILLCSTFDEIFKILLLRFNLFFSFSLFHFSHTKYLSLKKKFSE